MFETALQLRFKTSFKLPVEMRKRFGSIVNFLVRPFLLVRQKLFS